MQLVLFDIDGTLLLQASREHAIALHAALAEVYGVRVRERVPAAGRTDTAIARDLAALGGVDAERFDAGLEDFKATCIALFHELCPPSLEDHVAPGMRELLGSLSARGDVLLSLVTGNYQAVARLKLERAGLSVHFAAGQGAFGSDSEYRDELPPIARSRAGDHPRASTILIGDTPLDVRCARADGVRVLAVATGPCGPEELAGADAVVADGWALVAPLELALGGGG